MSCSCTLITQHRNRKTMGWTGGHITIASLQNIKVVQGADHRGYRGHIIFTGEQIRHCHPSGAECKLTAGWKAGVDVEWLPLVGGPGPARQPGLVPAAGPQQSGQPAREQQLGRLATRHHRAAQPHRDRAHQRLQPRPVIIPHTLDILGFFKVW